MTATGVGTLLGRQLFSIRVRQRCSSLAVWAQLRNKSDATDIGWDYETERKTFSLKAPEYYNFARDVVDKWAEKEKVIIAASNFHLSNIHKLIIIGPLVEIAKSECECKCT